MKQWKQIIYSTTLLINGKFPDKLNESKANNEAKNQRRSTGCQKARLVAQIIVTCVTSYVSRLRFDVSASVFPSRSNSSTLPADVRHSNWLIFVCEKRIKNYDFWKFFTKQLNLLVTLVLMQTFLIPAAWASSVLFKGSGQICKWFVGFIRNSINSHLHFSASLSSWHNETDWLVHIRST